jgi:ubiquinone/menaquinone biosynthesis C-methylase UbiE
VLHVAPEPSLRAVLEKLSQLQYTTGDLLAQDVDVELDLTAIDFPDHTFDVVLCSHVLEHIPDDRRAMREIRRVLKPDGWALINVPSDPDRAQTYEDLSIVSPEARLERFGQDDHVRVYGAVDFVARLKEAGFRVTKDPEAFSRGEIRRYRLAGDAGWDHSYLCRP